MPISKPFTTPSAPILPLAGVRLQVLKLNLPLPPPDCSTPYLCILFGFFILLCVRFLGKGSGGIFWKYWASRKDCKFCPLQSKCLTRKGSLTARYLLDNYFRSPVQKNIAQKESPEYRKALKKRQIWCEGTFAAQKWGHNLKRLLRRGLEAATDHCLLSATAINLKRMIKYMG